MVQMTWFLNTGILNSPNDLLHLFCHSLFNSAYAFRPTHVALCLSASFLLTAAPCYKVGITCLLDLFTLQSRPDCPQLSILHSILFWTFPMQVPSWGCMWLPLGMDLGAGELSQGYTPAYFNKVSPTKMLPGNWHQTTLCPQAPLPSHQLPGSLMSANLIEVKWSLTVILICISLMSLSSTDAS